ncbi:hypothetical protein GCK72_010421 [Caenorhabditis remanei]|uniref:Uncharacterized protein n=1 Tax=Caenorhabditis remanei TaxID=31234 RepID=A0A6A5H565_CAERE|nr:hypothetical protein GCK72_010421 [Caenorhabditis remanei]KAF1762159.1 hypothetical protein GCK72_010421 [Caenorhabditis remanei]
MALHRMEQSMTQFSQEEEINMTLQATSNNQEKGAVTSNINEINSMSSLDDSRSCMHLPALEEPSMSICCNKFGSISENSLILYNFGVLIVKHHRFFKDQHAT